jgi:hypothetical protein
MKVYRVVTKYAYSHPILFVVDNMTEVERLYKKHYPDGSDIISIELIEGSVINQWAQ